MSKILIDEATVKLALEALEAGEYYIDDLETIVYAADDLGTHEDRAKMQAAITALKALAEQPAQTQPGRNHWEDGDVFERIAAGATPQPAQPAPEDLGYVPFSDDGKSVFIDGFGMVPLAYPSFGAEQPARRKPLTVSEVEQILAQHNYEIHGDRARYIVRMTEVAHRIKENT